MNDAAAEQAVPREIVPITFSSYFVLPKKSSFWLTRIVFLRSLAFLYLIAFLVSWNQNEALIGPDGLQPVNAFLTAAERSMGKNVTFLEKVLTLPTLFWYTNFQNAANVITWLDLMPAIGIILSAWILIFGCANMIIMFTLWMLYHSIINVGQRWYSFGWETQILETGFLAIFLCPAFDLSSVPKMLPTPEVAVLGYRWLLFRIQLGSGLIKIRGDACWRDLTCMNYFYETQPIPNTLSLFYHFLPTKVHRYEVLTNHFIELLAPFLAIALPFRRVVILSGVIQILFQFFVILSGNLSFPNWLTILPAIFCLDDRFLRPIFSKSTLREVRTAEIEQCYGRNLYSVTKKVISISYSVIHWCVFTLIVFLSIPVVQNLVSQKQIMNTSFDTFRIVNTYGNFGSVTRNRSEVVFEGTHAKDPYDPDAVWLEYEFPCKPGNVTRRPCFVGPYHYRLDWLLWFTSFEPYQYNPWLLHLAGKMLDNDMKTLPHLLALNPFEKKAKPTWIRARYYSYNFARIASRDWKRKQWWVRKENQPGHFYLPPINRTMLNPIYKQFGWKNEQQSQFRSE